VTFCVLAKPIFFDLSSESFLLLKRSLNLGSFSSLIYPVSTLPSTFLTWCHYFLDLGVFLIVMVSSLFLYLVYLPVNRRWASSFFGLQAGILGGFRQFFFDLSFPSKIPPRAFIPFFMGFVVFFDALSVVLPSLRCVNSVVLTSRKVRGDALAGFNGLFFPPRF